MGKRIQSPRGREAYEALSRVYDSFMRNIPYQAWCQRITTYLQNKGYEKVPILELGCGTGSMTIRLAKKGYQMMGIDLSEPMLARARARSLRAGTEIYYDQQDMRALDFPYHVPVVLSVCDSMNYLMDVDELAACMAGVYQILSPGGLFLFDMKTENFYKELGDSCFTDSHRFGTYIWENTYVPEEKNNYYDLTFFVRKPMGLYKKMKEQQVQHAFSVTQVKSVAKRCGFYLEDHFGADMTSAPDLKGERMYFILRKPQE